MKGIVVEKDGTIRLADPSLEPLLKNRGLK